MKTRTRDSYQELSPETNEFIGKFMFAVFFPIFCLSIMFLSLINQGSVVLNMILFLCTSIAWGIFSYKKILTVDTYSFIFDTDEISEIPENIKHHQKFFSDSLRENEAKNFLKEHYSKGAIVNYFLLVFFIICACILLGAGMSEIQKWENTKTLIYISVVICIPTFFYILKVIQLRKMYTFTQKNLIFLSRGIGKYRVRSYKDIYFIFDKK